MKIVGIWNNDFDENIVRCTTDLAHLKIVCDENGPYRYIFPIPGIVRLIVSVE